MTSLSYFRKYASKLRKFFPLNCETSTPTNKETTYIFPSTSEYLATKIQPEVSVLDVGCGWGHLSEVLPESVKYTGIDFADEMLAFAKPKPNSKFLNDNFHLLSFEDNSFDVVVANESLQYGNLQNAFNEIHRVLKPDGVFYSKICLYADDPKPDISEILSSEAFKKYCDLYGLDRDPNIFGIRSVSEYRNELDRLFNSTVEANTEMNVAPIMKLIVNPILGLDKSDDYIDYVADFGLTESDVTEFKRTVLKFFSFVCCPWSSENFYRSVKK